MEQDGALDRLAAPAARAAVLPWRRTGDAGPRISSRFEFWPSGLFHAPIVVQWIALGLRYGDLSLPTAANPLVETGGLCGESKGSILDQAGPTLRAAIAPYAVIATPDLAAAVAAMRQVGLAFPVILKPDIGCNGAGVRLIADAAVLAAALPLYPADAPMMLQRYVEDEGEAGIFYIRKPGTAAGRVTSLTLKQAPSVTGDGRTTLRELVLRDPRAGKVPEMYLPRLADRLESVPQAGERVRLVLVGNHCRGSLFADGADDITPALTARVEAWARDLPEFHFGRIDVRFASRAGLRRGEGMTVIEVNGVGAEATHVWDPQARLGRAWADQFAHYADAFAIARANRARGFRPSGVLPMYRAWRRQLRLMAGYPVSD